MMHAASADGSLRHARNKCAFAPENVFAERRRQSDSVSRTMLSRDANGRPKSRSLARRRCAWRPFGSASYMRAHGGHRKISFS